ncbi:MAG: hypothetical protein ACJAYU_000405 [Bradymonadia bacterium]|jgi:hypothetical protein
MYLDVEFYGDEFASCATYDRDRELQIATVFVPAGEGITVIVATFDAPGVGVVPLTVRQTGLD